jgi:Mrp family chromosome partitioning ATPase
MVKSSAAAQVLSMPAEDQTGPEITFEFSPEVVMLSDPTGPRAESIRVLRTHLVAQHIELGKRAVALCGPSAGVGCSFVAVNLAVALSQIGLRTLLIDTNLRTRGVDQLIRPSIDAGGLRDCLAKGQPYGEQTYIDVLPKLSVLFSGGPTGDAQELLASNGFEQLLGGCVRDFDFTVVDTAPGNLYSDAYRTASLIGYAIVVSRRDKTFFHDVKTLVDHIQADFGQVVGTVLNEF